MRLAEYRFMAPWLRERDVKPPSPGLLPRAALVLALASVLGMLALAALRGPWLDEFFTIWMSDPALAAGEAYRDHWSTDLHPPFYYAAVWALRQLVPGDLFLLRLANAIPLLVIVPTIIAWRARRPADPWGPVYAGLVLSCPLVIAYFAELRSYFHVMAFAAALMAQLRLLRWQERDVSAQDWRFCLLVAVTILLALNVHFVAAVAIGVPIGVEILRAMLARRWRAAALLVVPSVIGTALLAAALAYLLTKTQPIAMFPAGPLAGLKLIVIGVLAGLALNPGVDLAILAALLARRAGNGRAIGWSVAELAGAAAVLFAYGLISNSLTLRYTLVLIPPAAALAADLAADALAASRWRIGAFVAGGIALQVATVAHEAVNKRWLTLADRIAAIVRDCPQTQVIAVDHGALIPPAQRLPVSGTIGAFDLAYRWIGTERGFAVTTTRDDVDTVVRPTACPVLLWSEHDFGSVPQPLDLARKARVGFPWPEPVVAAVHRTAEQRLIVIAPAPASARANLEPD